MKETRDGRLVKDIAMRFIVALEEVPQHIALPALELAVAERIQREDDGVRREELRNRFINTVKEMSEDKYRIIPS